MTRKQRPERHGFTMVELLVVILIICTLAAFVSAAVFRAMSLQFLRNTRDTIIKLDEELRKQMLAATAQAREEPIAPETMLFLRQAGGEPADIRELYIKYRLQQQFPESLEQIAGPFPPGMRTATYQQLIQGARLPQEIRSSVCLYLALSMNRSGAGFDPEGMSPQEIRSVPGNDKLKYFTDAWGQPLTFKNGVVLDTKTDVTPIIGSSGPNPYDPRDDISTAQFRQGQ